MNGAITREPTNAEKIRLLPWNIGLSAFNNIFAQLTFFGSAFVLFLNELGSNASQIGFLLSMLPFFGIVAIFIAPWVARFGYKRTFVTFFGIRKLITAGLLLTPWVLSQFGTEAALLLVTLVVMGFAFCRAVAEVGLYPWSQEFIPNSIRGKHSAVNDMVARITGMLAIGFGGFILGLSTGLDRFVLLFGVAVFFGLLAVWSASHLPGGAPIKVEGASYRNFLRVFRDGNFSRYLLALGLVTFGGAPLAFLPLFMQNQVGLSDSAIVWLQFGGIVGGFSATYLVGWAADRYGSKPVMMTGLYAKTLLPIAWLVMPRESEWSLPVALGIAFVWGIAEIAWGIGSGRLFFVKVIPAEKKADYMPVFYTSIGIIGGLSQILSGGALDATQGVSGQFYSFTLDPFTPLFIASIVLTGLSLLLFNRVQADSNVGVTEFAGMFVHGNPLGALESLFRYYRARDERATVAVTERMGLTKSPLTVDELLETLNDPRFNVRFEAIISIARMGNDRRLVDALCKILDGTELSLSVIAAWALGRMGDEHALPALRGGLNSNYRSIQAHCARSLATLGDTEVIPILHGRLEQETDKGLRIAYASSLGKLHATDSLPLLLDVLATTENEGARMELALAIARLIGDEQEFIQLLRRLRSDEGTTIAQVITSWKRKFHRDVRPMLDQCADWFAREQLHQGAEVLSDLMQEVRGAIDDPVRAAILDECAARLRESGATHLEYLLLTLYTVQSIDTKVPHISSES